MAERKTSTKKRSSAKRQSAGRSSSRKTAATAMPPAAQTAAAVSEAGDALYATLLEQVRATVEGVQEKPNQSNTYVRLLTKAGKAFAYIFPPRKGGVALKIPKQLLAVEGELPEGHGFKTTGWGLTRTVKAEADATIVAKALAVAAKAVEAE